MSDHPPEFIDALKFNLAVDEFQRAEYLLNLQSKLDIATEALENVIKNEGQMLLTEKPQYFTTIIATKALKLINGE